MSMDVHLIQNKDTEKKKRNSKIEYLRRLRSKSIQAYTLNVYV